MNPTQTTAIAPAAGAQVATAPVQKTFKELLAGERFQTQLAAALPKHLTPDRFTRILLTATMKNPLLLECTQESLFKGILDAAGAGVEIDSRRAHLIPYKNNTKRCYEAQLIIDYKGIAELIMRSGLVSSIHADIVCDKDVFEYDRGQVIKHSINLREDRGAMYAAYCIISMREGEAKCDVMSKADVEAIRRRSRAGNAGPWVTDFNEMAKKTVFRRASKWVPLSPEIRSVVEADDTADEPVNVTPKAGLLAMIGAAEPAGGSGAFITEETVTEEVQPAKETVKPFTPAERERLLKEVEALMLTHEVGESKVITYLKDAGHYREGLDEVSALPAAVLDHLLGVVASLKKGGAK